MNLSVLPPFITLLLTTTLLWTPEKSEAKEIRVAVASNFGKAMKSLAAQFEAKSGHQLVLAFGSTGKLFAQIQNDAPFELFFAADALRPMTLEKKGLGIAGTRFTYALGKIVLWSPHSQKSALEQGDFNYIAIANPKLAPYGKAAYEFLKSKGLWNKFKSKIVRGENIAQAFQFVISGNADLGFVALSQVKNLQKSYWEIPQKDYTPIEQQAILLKENPVARAFLNFIKGKVSRKMIENHGYGVPKNAR